jgi:hypothetical protein
MKWFRYPDDLLHQLWIGDQDRFEAAVISIDWLVLLIMGFF